MLSRLSIRQKLSLLLVIPLVSVGLVMVGITVERIQEARAAGTTARTALAARNIGALIQTLQQERLLALGYLSVPSLQRSALITQSQTAADDAGRLGVDPVTADVIAAARPALDALDTIRRGVVNRTVSPRTAYDAYRAANTALLDALRLGSPGSADVAGLGELVALDALMRSNEEASSVGAIVVGSAADPTLSATVLTGVVSADAQDLRRFRQLVGPEQASLVDTVENGQAGQRIRNLVGQIVDGEPPQTPAAVSEALTAALTYTGLRRLAQDRVARDVADAAQSRASSAEALAAGVTIGATVLFATVVTLGVVVSRSISRPLRRLTRAAAVVADLSGAELVRVADSDSPDPTPPKLAAVDVDSADEIGELAAALNRVQATAALLLERQVTTRANVSTMFANIARRTQNLVGRQLTLIDELERSERDPDLLQRLYRLDHVATRLRRSADSLLVVSGTIDQHLSGTPTRLADVVRSALAEIEGYQAVQLGQLPDVAIAADLVGDLRLLLAELIENATNFSPPGTPVEVTAMLNPVGDQSTGWPEEELYILVVDHGVGLSANRIEEENRRLVERERLDVAPTRVLGLFVVGRLARRHGLGVRLDPSTGRGVTATVLVPPRLLAQPSAVVPGPRLPGPARPAPAPGVVPPRAIEALRAAQRNGPFPWLDRSLPAIGSAPSPAPPPGTTSPGTATPGTATPGTATPGTATPGTATPGAGASPAAVGVDEIWPGGLTPSGPAGQTSSSPPSGGVPRHGARSDAPAGPPPSWPPAPSGTSGERSGLPRRTVAGQPDPAFSADPHAADRPAVPAPSATTFPVSPPPPASAATAPPSTSPSMSQTSAATPSTAEPALSAAVPAAAVPGNAGESEDTDGGRDGLMRRVPGTHLTDAASLGLEEEGTGRGPRDPDNERNELNDYLAGFERATIDPVQQDVDGTQSDPAPVDVDSHPETTDDPGLESRPTLAERHS